MVVTEGSQHIHRSNNGNHGKCQNSYFSAVSMWYFWRMFLLWSLYFGWMQHR